jgi:hypothetical protein
VSPILAELTCPAWTGSAHPLQAKTAYFLKLRFYRDFVQLEIGCFANRHLFRRAESIHPLTRKVQPI